MSVQPTEIPDLTDQTIPAPESPAAEPLTPQRHGFMAALGAAETMLSSSPVLPISIEIHCTPWDVAGVRVEPYFHLDPDSVQAFAEHIGGDLSTRDRLGDLLTEARGVVNGVPVRAWSLTDSPIPAEAEQSPVTA